jgi:hypothetical protein
VVIPRLPSAVEVAGLDAEVSMLMFHFSRKYVRALRRHLASLEEARQ